ncbi:MAG: hypothetical protein JXB47_02795 [Anaerolineae bacterium]|nr:hypothetical protein [Anaerolineae bacterium]
MVDLSEVQVDLVAQPVARKIFLEGAAGTGKTTAAVARMRRLLESGVPAAHLLVMAPQRTLALPYVEALAGAGLESGGEATVVTLGGLARRMIDLFWPLVAERAGFAHPDRPPTFLTLETAQYHMARLVRPLIEEQGYFETLTIDRNRLYSQVLDNLNKAAVVGFDYHEIGARLAEAWSGESSQQHVYQHAQEAASRFRAYCLQHNLLDFSLQIELFMRDLINEDLCRDYLARSYRHLIADNIEEDTPTAHDLLAAWLPAFESALLIYDHDAGYRAFLGADAGNAHMLHALCDTHVVFDQSYVITEDLYALSYALAAGLNRLPEVPDAIPGDPRAALDFQYLKRDDDSNRPYPRYHPEMLDRVAEEIARLVHDEGTPPGEIVVLAPFLTDALRFALTTRLADKDVPARSHRPSRALREEPATLGLLTLAALAHPDWHICPTAYDAAYTLMQAIEGMDLVRAQLLASIVYRVKDGAPALGTFDQINPEMQDRITYRHGERYAHLRDWITAYIDAGEAQPLDHFLGRLFGEVLAQPGYGFHANFDAAAITANVIESARKFRWAMEEAGTGGEIPLGKEYLLMVQEGVIAALSVPRWDDPGADSGAVLLAPAYTFLLRNRPATYQFWLNVGSVGWWERLYQPLTHPYVLRRDWPPGMQWTDANEFAVRQDALHRVTQGLVRRCRDKIYLGLSELDEQGNAQQGPLLKTISGVVRRSAGQG